MALQGKNAVITGSGRGIGRGIALALAARGCNVAINFFRKRSAAEQTAKEAAALGVQTAVIKANMVKEAEVKHLVDEAAKQLGGVDIFVGNAASGVLKPVMEIETKDWDWTVDINVRSVLAGVQTALPYMQRNGWGRIITISSIGSHRVHPGYSIIGISKAALEALTRYLAVELAPQGIVANCVSPGLVATQALDLFPQKETMVAYVEQQTPAGRLATPKDVGNIVAWLCSDDAAMIVGQTIEVDGGYSLRMQG